MNIDEAIQREFERGKKVIYVPVDESCNLCGRKDELRAGSCYFCKEFVETDMIEAWDRRNPTNRWPYVWITAPAEVPEEAVIAAQKAAEKFSIDRNRE